MRYIVIPDDAVDTSTYKAAHRALASARKELKLPNIDIKWFVSARYKAKYQLEKCESFECEQPINGMFCAAEPRTIYIHALQEDVSLKNSVYHETYHLWQRYSGYYLTEELAEEYSEDIAARLAAFGDNDSVYWDHTAGKDWSEPKQQKRSESDKKRQPGVSLTSPFTKKTNADPITEQLIKIKKTGYIEYDTAQSKVGRKSS